MIENLEINEYKGLIDFKLDNLSQINIISGKNNVGKTMLLEAISVSKNITDLRLFKKNMEFIYLRRELNYDDIYEKLKKISLNIKSSENNVIIKAKSSYELEEDEAQLLKKQYYDPTTKEFLTMYHNDELKDIISLTKENEVSIVTFQTLFINSSLPNNYYLTQLYKSIQDSDMQSKFLEYLQIIDKNISGIEPYATHIVAQDGNSIQSFALRVTLENPKHSLLSSELGEGTNRFIEILCTLLSNKNGTVLIDEIENGIHYTKLYDIWKAIIEIVQKEKIQLFVTTHDKESIEALIKASQDTDYNKVTSIKLFRNEENQIEPSIKNFELFEYGIDMGADVR